MDDAPTVTQKSGRTAAGAAREEAEDNQFLAALAARVREARHRSGLSRKALAQAAGVSERYLAQLESGETNASIVPLRRVARALDVTLGDLVEPRLEDAGERRIRRLLERLPAHRREEVVLRLGRDLDTEQGQRRRRIALVGLRGGGKSTLGRRLAAEMQVRFVELNDEIEREAGMKSSEIFMLYGESGFRRIERRCLEKLVGDDQAAVISVGGGVVSDPETFNLLLENCVTVWIRATPEEHMARVVAQGDLRPMAGHAEAMGDMKRILTAREPLYRRADLTLDTTGETPDQSLDRLRQVLSS